MNPLAIKGLGLILVIALLVGLGYHRGNASAVREFLPQIEQLKAVIEATDAQAHETVKEQEKNHDEIAKSHADNVASVVAFYDRLLRKTRDKAGSSTTTVSPEVPDGTTSEPRACEPDIEFTRDCALDAIKVMGFQDWVRVNLIPVE